MRLLLLLSLFSAALLGGCAHKKPKSATHVFGEDAPSIRYSAEQERAGGYMRTF